MPSGNRRPNKLNMTTISFDPAKFNFHQIIRELLGAGNLSEIVVKDEDKSRIKTEFSIYKNMEQTDLYDRLNEKLQDESGDKFYSLYHQFVKDVVRPRYDEAIFYQKKPTHRIHFQNGSGAERFHTDMDYGHHRCEINYTVPQTPMYGTNSIWIESEEGLKDYQPMEAKVGEMVEFNGSFLKHGAKKNETGETRVSFDFRIVRYSDAPEPYKNKALWDHYDSKHPLFKHFDDFRLCK